ncbi:MAG TPA: M56 family metallopeptidase [Gemmatimonadaceae bacterium]|nr:M56 family metallopeptidase [Gemmatimonadaceae bacterium]
MLCILYVNVVGSLLTIMGILAERSLPAKFPRRWMWCGIILIGMAIPGAYRVNHNVEIADVMNQSAVGWWAGIESYCSTINRVWPLLSLGIMVWGIANLLRVARTVHMSRANATMIDGVSVLVTDALGPATVGLLRSRVLVPKWVLALPGNQRQYVVRHEQEHRNANDARLLLFMSLSLILAPWSLALWWQLRRLRLAVEMDCDNRVIAALGNPMAYGNLLLRVAEAANRGPRLQPAFLGGVGTLEKRLTRLLAPAPLRHAQKFLLPAAAVVLLALAVSLPHPVHTMTHTHNAVVSTR